MSTRKKVEISITYIHTYIHSIYSYAYYVWIYIYITVWQWLGFPIEIFEVVSQVTVGVSRFPGNSSASFVQVMPGLLPQLGWDRETVLGDWRGPRIPWFLTICSSYLFLGKIPYQTLKPTDFVKEFLFFGGSGGSLRLAYRVILVHWRATVVDLSYWGIRTRTTLNQQWQIESKRLCKNSQAKWLAGDWVNEQKVSKSCMFKRLWLNQIAMSMTRWSNLFQG